jgi:hypothetical protein
LTLGGWRRRGLLAGQEPDSLVELSDCTLVCVLAVRLMLDKPTVGQAQLIVDVNAR